MTRPRVAQTEICDSKSCVRTNLLVRGDAIEFVSNEQVRKVGKHPLDPVGMPSDIKLPTTHVLVHDTTGEVLDRCHFYIVKWHQKGTKKAPTTNGSAELRAARDYFGDDARLKFGSVEIPQGPWKRLSKIGFIRYSRYGFEKPFEHEYDTSVMLYDCVSPLAWRVVLPTGCIVDSRGFVWP